MQRHHLADDALLFDLGDASPATTARACALAAANRPLLLRFDPCSDAADALPALIERLVATLEIAPAANGRTISFPVRYGDAVRPSGSSARRWRYNRGRH